MDGNGRCSPESKNALPSNYVTSIYCDPETDDVWAGFGFVSGQTSKKVARWTGDCWVVYENRKKKDRETGPKLKENPAATGEADALPGKIELVAKRTLLPLEGFEGTFKKMVDDDTRPSSAANPTCSVRTGDRWLFGTQGYGVVAYDGGNFLFMAGNGDLPSDEVMAMIRDGWGNTWIGTRSGIFKRNDEEDDEFFTYAAGRENTIPANDVKCLKLDDMNMMDLWVGLGPSDGLPQGGLARYNGFYWQYFQTGTVNDIAMEFPNLLLATERGLIFVERR